MPESTATARVAELLAALDRHRAASPREERSLRRIRSLVRWLPRPFDEHADPTHVTTSAIVTDGAGHVVMHRHRRLGIWLQPGGHVDPGEAPEAAVLREVREETGLSPRFHADTPGLLHVDVHEGGRGHLHLDLRYLLRLPPGSEFAPAPGESREVAWLTFDEAARRGDLSVTEAIRAARRALGEGPPTPGSGAASP